MAGSAQASIPPVDVVAQDGSVVGAGVQHSLDLGGGISDVDEVRLILNLDGMIKHIIALRISVTK